MSNLIFVYTTCGNLEQAKKIASYILRKHLCACVNILPGVTSFFIWPEQSDGISDEFEIGMIIKTVSDRFSDLELAIREIHPYAVPCIIAIPVCNANQEYEKWVKQSIF